MCRFRGGQPPRKGEGHLTTLPPLQVVQALGLRTSTAGARVQSLVTELRPPTCYAMQTKKEKNAAFPKPLPFYWWWQSNSDKE